MVPVSKQSLAEHVIRHPDVMRQNCRPKKELEIIMAIYTAEIIWVRGDQNFVDN